MKDPQYGHADPIRLPAMNFSIRVNGSSQEQGSWINHKQLALVCEGGGQRGIFTAGILDSFMENDFLPFHTLIGVSAGAQNLSAYACGARGYAHNAIVNFTTRKTFFDPLRFARGGHLVDLDWYFDTLHHEAPLDFESGRRRLKGRSLHVCASRCDTLAAEYLPFHVGNLQQSLKASSAIPLFYRGGVAIDGVDYWDGGVADALPVQTAHARGSDCIVVIRTQPRESGNSLLTLPRGLGRGGFQEIAALVASHMRSYRAAENFVEEPPDAVTVIEIAPSQPLKSSVLLSTTDALEHDYRMGQICGHAFLDSYAPRLRCQAFNT